MAIYTFDGSAELAANLEDEIISFVDEARISRLREAKPEPKRISRLREAKLALEPVLDNEYESDEDNANIVEKKYRDIVEKSADIDFDGKFLNSPCKGSYDSAFECCPKMKVDLKSGLLASLADDWSSMTGPHVETNWLIPGRVLCGSHPTASHFRNGTKDEKVAKIMSAGVSLFVDLTSGYRKYWKLAVKWAAQNKAMKPRFAQHNLAEFSPGSAAVITAAVRSIIMELERSPDAVVYLHCRAGHGRTGMVAAVLLGAVYPAIEVDKVMQLVQEFHDSRVDSWNNWHSPETAEQVVCARELIVVARKMGPEAFTKEVSLTSNLITERFIDSDILDEKLLEGLRRC